MNLAHQYEVTITCDQPSLFMNHGGPLPVLTLRGDYETVSKALGMPEFPAFVRSQLDRFEQSLNAGDPASQGG